MMDVADRQQNRIAKKTLRDTIELLLLVELDRAEQEREITVKRIRDGIAASPKKSGRPNGKLDKMTPELESDIQKYIAQSVTDRTITIADLMRKHNLTRNTVTKYIRITEQKIEAK
jgi:DNA invertase Pin-like site-specific DNA recombinase